MHINPARLSGTGWCELCVSVHATIGQQHRYAHSLRVARLAGQLAARHGFDPKPARVAGLLHDLARLWSAETLLTACKERGLGVDDFEARNPIVLHARIGVLLAHETYGVEDTGILQAIARHTVGAADMSPLDAVVFLADALEPGRDFADRRDLLDLAQKDLYGGLYAVYSSTKSYLEQRGLQAAPQLDAAIAAMRGRMST